MVAGVTLEPSCRASDRHRRSLLPRPGPGPLSAWYAQHLGVPADEAGHAISPESRNTVWSPFTADTDYWPREKQGMVNFTVTDLDAMLAQLRAAGVDVDDKVEDHEYGRFGWFTDPEGNRVELWQPLGPAASGQ
jgi:catechol 2,3-dioxygenase-like lactoylglutathione lyase family enzyme